MHSCIPTTLTLLFVIGLEMGGVRSDVAGTDRDMQRLLTDLVSYPKEVRPMRNFSDTLTIAIGLKLQDIINFQDGILTARITVELIWNNYWMRWKPEAYGGIKHSVLPTNQIWHPDIALYNSVDDSHYFHGPTIKVYYTGYQEWKSTQIVRALCTQPAEPRTEYRCGFTLGSWTYEGDSLDVQHKSGRFLNTVSTDHGGNTKTWKVTPGIDLSEFQPSLHWNVTMPETLNVINYQKEPPVVELKFRFTLNRLVGLGTSPRTLIWFLLMFLPVITFLVPVQSGQKVSLGGINFLLVILTLTQAPNRPVDEEAQNLWVFTLVLDFLAILGAVAVVWAYSGISTMSKVVRSVLEVLAKLTFVPLPAVAGTGAENSVDNSTPGLQVISKHLKDEEAVESIKSDWLCLSTVINRLCLGISISLFIIGLILFFC